MPGLTPSLSINGLGRVMAFNHLGALAPSSNEATAPGKVTDIQPSEAEMAEISLNGIARRNPPRKTSVSVSRCAFPSDSRTDPRLDSPPDSRPSSRTVQ